MALPPGATKLFSGLKGQNQYGNISAEGIRGAQGLGFFDPRGSPALRESLRRGAIRTARNRRLRGRTVFGLGGLDPASARAASLDLEQDVGKQTGDFLNEANLQEEVGNRDYFRGQLGEAVGFERQRELEHIRAKAAEKAAKASRGNPLAQLGGAALGSFFG